MVKAFLRSVLYSCAILVVLLCFPSFSMSQGIGVWSNLGLYGGQIYEIAIDPTNPNKMFAGAYQGDGLFVSEDGGGHWQAVETENNPEGEATFKNQTVLAIEIAPSDNNVIWVTHDYWVEKSTDGGKTWTHITNADMQSNCANCPPNDNFRFCQAIAIDPADPNIVYVGTGGPYGSSINGAIYKTADGGTTWTKLGGIFDFDFNPIEDFNYSMISIQIETTSNTIWAATGSGDAWWGSIYRSNNEGQTWFQDGIVGTDCYDMVVQPRNPEEPTNVFVANAQGLLRFTYLSDEPGSKLGSFSWVLGGVWGAENYIRAVVFDPQNPQTVYAAWRSPIAWGGDGIGKVGRSTDGGDSWSVYQPKPQFFCLEVHPTNPELVFGGHLNLGVYKSQDHGQTWTPINDGLTAVVVKDVAVDPNSGAHVLIGTISGVYEKTGAGPWSRLLENDTWSVLFHPTDSLTFFAGIEAYVCKTTDGGQNWTSANIPDYWSYNSISDMAIDTSNTDVMFVSVDYFDQGGAVHKSTDGGSSFTGVLNGLNQAGQDVPMNAVAIDPLNPQHIFAGGGRFTAPCAVGDLWESTDGGANWTRTSLQNVIVNAILVDTQDPDIVYAGCGCGGGTTTPLYKSIDNGATWTPSFDGIPQNLDWNAVTDLVFHRKKMTNPLHKDVVYASTLLAGVYVSPNQAANWLNFGTPEYHVHAISTSSLYAASQGGLLQCTGTGVVAGRVTNAVTKAGVHNATVSNDLGAKTISVRGEYLMVSPSGMCDMTATLEPYVDGTVQNVTVLGGDVTWANIAMGVDALSEKIDPPGDAGNSGGGGKCFIDAAANGPCMVRQVNTFYTILGSWILIGFLSVLRGLLGLDVR